MRHHHNCLVLFLIELAEELKYHLGRRKVEVGRWLIREQDLWAVYQGSGYSSSLLFPTRDLTGMVFHAISEPYRF